MVTEAIFYYVRPDLALLCISFSRLSPVITLETPMYPGKRLQLLEGGLWVKPRASFHEGWGESCSHPHTKLPGPQSLEGQMAVQWGGAQRGKPGAFVPKAAGLAARRWGGAEEAPQDQVSASPLLTCTSQRPSNCPSWVRRLSRQLHAQLNSGVRGGESSGGNGLCLKLLWLELLKKLTVNLRWGIHVYLQMQCFS